MSREDGRLKALLEIVAKLFLIVFVVIGLLLSIIFGVKTIGYSWSIDMSHLVSKVYALLLSSANQSDKTDTMIAILSVIIAMFLGSAIFLTIMGYKHIRSQLETDFLNNDKNAHLKKEKIDKMSENIEELKTVVFPVKDKSDKQEDSAKNDNKTFDNPRKNKKGKRK